MAEKEEDSDLMNQESEKIGEVSEMTIHEEASHYKTCISSLEPATSDANLCGNEGAQIASKDKKIDVLLKATGDAPIMKKKKWAVSQDYPIGRISEFIKKYIKLNSDERLFLYINQTFAPAPDQTVKNLYDCYGSDGKLIIHYCKSQAWG